MSLKEKLQSKEQQMVDTGRHLHENPEMSFEEENTAKFIEDFYNDKTGLLFINLKKRPVYFKRGTLL